MNVRSEISNLQSRQWLETDGLGGFASGTASDIRTRRYHALLLTTVTPPTGRVVLVNDFEPWIETPRGCPFEAWSASEGLRWDQIVLKERNQARPRHRTTGSGTGAPDRICPKLMAA